MSNKSKEPAMGYLIAAAPHMVKALEEIRDRLESHPDVNIGNTKVHYCYHIARRAIAKARGTP